ncbi:MAG: LemA family protein [Euryarchaeota archaeon]|nr:LemA family protein [Euryarchaeota archaeon]MBU4140203.1 LemA family protein [Euryarchaeota archaeon]
MSLNKVVAAIVVLVLLVGGIFFFTYNGLVSAEESVDAQWYQVENQYQRRADLIPNLIETVKGYAAHEEKVFTEVAKYRSQWSAAANQEEKMAAAEGMDSAISRLLVVVESYPQLKANENFLALQAQLEGTENRIAVERMRYNEKVRDYNTQLKRIPSSMIAGMIGSEPKAYFKADKGAQDVPKVNFNQPGATTSPSASPSATTSPTITNASVELYGDKTDVEVGENIVLKLSAVNLITKPEMTVQVILKPPSGMSVTSSEFVVAGAGQYTSTYKLQPGSARNIEIMLKTTQTGNFIVEGRVIYYFGTDLSTQEDHTLKLPVKVRNKKPIT